MVSLLVLCWCSISHMATVVLGWKTESARSESPWLVCMSDSILSIRFLRI